MNDNNTGTITPTDDKVNTEKVEQDGTGENRDEKGRFIDCGNPNGRPKETEEEKAKKKALKKVVEDYVDSLKEALPKISPVLIAKALEGDMNAVKEINDRTMGKPKQQMELSGDKENPLEINIVNYGERNNDSV